MLLQFCSVSLKGTGDLQLTKGPSTDRRLVHLMMCVSHGGQRHHFFRTTQTHSCRCRCRYVYLQFSFLCIICHIQHFGQLKSHLPAVAITFAPTCIQPSTCQFINDRFQHTCKGHLRRYCCCVAYICICNVLHLVTILLHTSMVEV